MIENEQDQPPAGGVSRHGKVLRDFNSNLIRIGTGPAVTLGRGSASAVGNKSGIRRWSEAAFRADEGINQIVEALTRKPELHVADIFSAAIDYYLLLVVGEAGRFNLGNSYCHSFRSP